MTPLELVSHHLCPYVQRAAIALHEKRVPFTLTRIDLADKPAWFAAVSPLGKVPLLKVEGQVLFESAAILEYLEDTQPRPLHPRDPVERARHRAWIEFGSTVLNDIWAFYTAADEAVFAQKHAMLRERFARLEQALDAAGPFFTGADFTLVDAVFAPVFRYWGVFELLPEVDTFAGLPRVQAWRQRLAARPSVQDAVPGDYAQRLLAFVVAQQGELGRRLAREAVAA